jgi:DNA-directed RNA polymerase subunit omega
MARVTVEDCLKKVSNRFALVHIAARRTKQLLKGSKALIKKDNKEIVIALREIAAGLVSYTEEQKIAEMVQSELTKVVTSEEQEMARQNSEEKVYTVDLSEHEDID